MFRRRVNPRQPSCSDIQFSRYGFAVVHRSRSGSRSRPSPSMFNSVFCSITSWGWISTLNWREVWNSRSSTRPKEISLQRLVEDWFAYCTDRGFEIINARIFWCPPRLNMRFRHPLIVAAEKCKEILRQIILVLVSEGAHYAEVHRDVTSVAARQKYFQDAYRHGNSHHGIPG